MKLPVCICGKDKVAAEHTLDVHDEITGECRSMSQGLQCSCTRWIWSGKWIEVPNE